MFNKKRDAKSVTQDILLLKRKISDFEGAINDQEEQILKMRQDKLATGGKVDDKALQDELRENWLNLRAASAAIDEHESALFALMTEEVKKEHLAATAALEKLIGDIEAANKTFFEELGRIEAFRELNLAHSTKGLGEYIRLVADNEDYIAFSSALEKTKKEQRAESLVQKFVGAQNTIEYLEKTPLEEIVRSRMSELLHEEKK